MTLLGLANGEVKLRDVPMMEVPVRCLSFEAGCVRDRYGWESS